MLWAVALLPLLSAPLIYLSSQRVGRNGLTLGAALVVLASLAVAGMALLGDVGGAGPAMYRWSGSLALTLTRSTAGDVFMLTVPLIALPIIIFAGYHDVSLRDERGTIKASGARLLALLLGFVGAMQLLVLANDLLTLLIAWELVGACSWALIAHRWGEADIPRDAAQAFLVTRLGDLGLYIAAAAVFAGTGGFGYTDLAALDGGLLHVAVGGIVLAAAAKSAQLPFSAWLFAAMSGPVSVSALLHSATMVAAGIYLLARLQPVLSEVAWFMPVVIAIGLVTALAAGVVGAFQGHAKKLLAASTSAQYGLMWVAVGAGFPGVALLHFVAHAFLKAGLFLSSGLAERQSGSYALDSMHLGRRMPGVAAITAIFSLALAGMIPLGAAWSKEQIAAAAADQASWLALLVALAGGLSALYATRFQLLAYGRPGRHDDARLPDTPLPSKPEVGTLGFFAAGTLALSLLWWPSLHQALDDVLTVRLPPGHRWLLIVSLAMVVLGIAVGTGMTRQERPAEMTGWRRVAAGWLGLPALTQGVAASVSTLSRCLAHFDDHRIDALARAVAWRVGTASRGLARFDDGVVDAGLRATARLAQWLARCYASRGEAFSEGVPGGLSRLAEQGGRWARQAHTGQTHHYYTAIAAGLASLLVMLVIGALL